MTGKLLKYELRSSYAYMLAIWAAMVVTSFMASLTPGVTGSESSLIVQFLKELPTFLFVAASIALAVAMIFVIVFRFYNGLLGEEGYLMHTLPVREWELITAKGLSALIFTIGSGLVVVISTVIFGHSLFLSSEFLHELGGVFHALDVNDYVIGIEIIVLLISSIIKTIYQVYASLAIGQLADKHRILLSVGAYIGISIALSVVFAGVLGLLAPTVNFIGFDPFTSEHEYMYIQSLLGIALLLTLLQIVLFHVITERILSKKLNLL